MISHTHTHIHAVLTRSTFPFAVCCTIESVGTGTMVTTHVMHHMLHMKRVVWHCMYVVGVCIAA